MKTVLHTIYSLFESIGRARAASYYTRLGNHDAARKVMLD